MERFNFITIRLGKDSIPDIQNISSSITGILNNPFTISVKCTQIPENYETGDYAFLWLGSDNNKGMPTRWKQGFKAVGRVLKVIRGEKYNDTSDTYIEIIYIFDEAISRIDVLRSAPIAYYWCSSLPLIGLEDHANQTIRNMSGNSFADIRAFFSAIEAVTHHFKKDITQIEPKFDTFFDISLPNPQSYPNANNIDDINHTEQIAKCTKSFQQIFYGAPGTGKSNTIKREVEEKGRIHFRITFHPDSDYSTFVGTYKPTKVMPPKEIYTFDELKLLYNEFKKTAYSRPEIRFAGRYHEALQHLSKDDLRKVFEGSQDSVIGSEIVKGIAAASAYAEAHKKSNTTITYEFVPQAFTKAYCEAWNHYNENEESEPVYLIIEEINRGNCAQIFGDIFQLLDRKNGFSEYPIDADEDLKKFLLNGTKDDGTPWLVNKNGIENGQLCLPSNLHIWATMNTSDQSLFPIDSAFKRRWDWKYMPIDYDKEKWSIVAKSVQYSWSDFLKKINNLVASLTDSEDKMLGFYFAKAKDGIIDADTFVGKVVFYLWNDLFKDYGLPKEILKGAESKEFAFRNFFMADGHANEDMVKRLLDNLEVDKPTDTDFPVEDAENQDEA